MAEPAQKKKIVLVGHCGPDSYALKSAVGRAAPGTEVVFVNDDVGAVQAAGNADLLLINRVLDGSFAAEDGIELIGELIAKGSARVMLISNYPDAQAEAEMAGAVPGFGKTTMNAPETQRRIREAITNR